MKLPGNLYIVAAPSGGGKTSLVKALLADLVNIEVSVSHTTREQRPYEKDGRDYHFVSDSEFTQMVEENAFIEHATVFKHNYGTAKAPLMARLEQGIDVLLDIDWQGAEQLKELFPNVVTVFILPPSLEVLESRLQKRAQDSDAIIASRMQQAKSEISHYPAFDYLIINEVFEQALAELKAIVHANRLKRGVQAIRYEKLLSNLLN